MLKIIGGIAVIIIAIGLSVYDFNGEAVMEGSSYTTLPLKTPLMSNYALLIDDLCGLEVVLCENEVKAVISAYTASEAECDADPCRTADGTFICPAMENIAAANWLPMGSFILLDGIKYRIADRMNSRYDGSDGKYYVDILMTDRQEALNWGRQIKTITILK